MPVAQNFAYADAKASARRAQLIDASSCIASLCLVACLAICDMLISRPLPAFADQNSRSIVPVQTPSQPSTTIDASPTPNPAPSTYKVSAPTMLHRLVRPPADLAGKVESTFAAIARGRLDRSTLTAAANADLSDARVRAMSEEARLLGTPVTFELLHAFAVGSDASFIYRVESSASILDFIVELDATGKFSALSLTHATSQSPVQVDRCPTNGRRGSDAVVPLMNTAPV